MAPNFCVTEEVKLYPENEREGVGMRRRGEGKVGAASGL